MSTMISTLRRLLRSGDKDSYRAFDNAKRPSPAANKRRVNQAEPKGEIALATDAVVALRREANTGRPRSAKLATSLKKVRREVRKAYRESVALERSGDVAAAQQLLDTLFNPA